MNIWVEVDPAVLRENAVKLNNLLRVPIMAVVKGNAYGLGLAECAGALSGFVDAFAVQNCQEALLLRQGDIKEDILSFDLECFSEAGKKATREAIRDGILLTVGSLQAAEQLVKLGRQSGKTPRVHLEIDVGMGRKGLSPRELSPELAGVLAELDVRGTYCHFSVHYAKHSRRFMEEWQLFNAALDRLRNLGINTGTVHCANSAAALEFPGCRLDMVRIGNLLYGYNFTSVGTGVKTPHQVLARVLEIKEYEESRRVNYNLSGRVSPGARGAMVEMGLYHGIGRERVIFTNLVDYLKMLLRSGRNQLLQRSPFMFKERSLRFLGCPNMTTSLLDVSGCDVEPGTVLEVNISPLLVPQGVPRVALQGGRSLDKKQRSAATS